MRLNMSPTCANRPVWQMIIVTLLQRQYENESQMLTQITYVHTSVSALSFYAGNAFGQLFVLSTALRERSTVLLNSMQTLPMSSWEMNWGSQLLANLHLPRKICLFNVVCWMCFSYWLMGKQSYGRNIPTLNSSCDYQMLQLYFSI